VLFIRAEAIVSYWGFGVKLTILSKSSIGLYSLALIFAVFSGSAQAQAQAQMVDLSVSNPAIVSMTGGALSAESVASFALANVDDKAIADRESLRLERFRELMELNGSARYVRDQVASLGSVTREVAMKNLNIQSFTPEQERRFFQISTQILKKVEADILNDLARSQSRHFTIEEIQTLIKANSSTSAVKYNIAKFSDPKASQSLITSYMVEAVVSIIKSFKETIQS
jgi:hypothetical protein